MALHRRQTVQSRKPAPEETGRINSETAINQFSANSYYSNNTQGYAIGANNNVIRNLITNPSSKDKNEQDQNYSDQLNQNQVPHILPQNLQVRSSFGDHQTSYFPNQPPHNQHFLMPGYMEESKEGEGMVTGEDLQSLQEGFLKIGINTSAYNGASSLKNAFFDKGQSSFEQNCSNELQSLGSIKKSDAIYKNKQHQSN